MTRIAALLRGLGSLAVLLALVIGPPMVLGSWVGWPLPTSVPDVSSVEQALRVGVNDDVIVKALAIVAWLAWAQIAIAVLAEVVAVVRRRPSIHLPVVPGVQAMAGRLVASVALMAAAFSPAGAAMADPATPIPAVALANTPAPPIVLAESVPAALPEPSPVAATPKAELATVVVERHDSFWAIAERTLGDGYRWREIRDLNVGRTMNTGDVVQPGSDLVHPGWVLELPADAVVPASDSSFVPVSAAAVAADLAVDHEVTVEPGDSFWILAEEQLTAANGMDPSDAQVTPYWASMIEANQDRLVQPGNPNLIVPGQQICAPAVPGAMPAVDAIGGPSAPEPTAEIEPPAQVEAAPPVPTGFALPPATLPPQQIPPSMTLIAPSSAAVDDVDGEGPSATSEALVGVAGAGLAATLAVGAVRTIRRRRRQASIRSGDQVPPQTSDDDRDLHHRLLVDGDETVVDDLRNQLGRLAQDLAAAGIDTRPRVVQAGRDHIDVVLAHPNEAPVNGWESVADGAVWTGHAGGTSPDGSAPVAAAPLLVTLGQPDEDGQLHLDLEAEGLVALTGDVDVAADVARAIVAELALSPLADCLEVIVIGNLAPPEVKTLEHVTVVEEWDDVIEDLMSWSRHTHEALDENGWPNAFVARGTDSMHDALAPVAVVASTPPPPVLVDHLAAHQPSTLAVVAVGDFAGGTAIECGVDSLTVVDLGLVCTPLLVAEEELQGLIRLVAACDVIEPGPVDPSDAAAAPDSNAEASGSEEPEVDVLVRVLGEIRVDGGDPLSPKQTAVVTYIAIHGTVSADRLEDAVWASAGTTSRRKRLANTLAECRAAIGRRYLPPSAEGKYSPGAGLVSDIELFAVRVKRAATQEPEDAVDTLMSALELVTGPPFTYRSGDRASFAWVELENWISRWELKIASAAERCADLLLDLGRTDDAVAVAGQGLSAIPTHASLTRALMRAHAAGGDRSAARRVYDEYTAALDALDLDVGSVDMSN